MHAKCHVMIFYTKQDKYTVLNHKQDKYTLNKLYLVSKSFFK